MTFARSRQTWRVLGTACFLALVGCEDQGSSPRLTAFSAQTDLQVEITTWSHGKKAALTLAFDDTRASSHEIVAPALESHGMRGTFNINTAVAASNWTPWVRLAEAGHELGNHTRHHLRLAEIPLADARAEIEGGREDLLANIPGLADVVSFTYPEGQSSIEIRAIVMETHLSARGYWGWNQPTPEDYSRISGRSYRDPATLTQDLNRCVSTHTWLVQYFHAVGNQALSVEEFDTYLDLVTSHQDSLWVATQGEGDQVHAGARQRHRARPGQRSGYGDHLECARYAAL
jgi:peptidoglycan/xylan/chitin deacetylase (PgdA/CDA1 family)